MKFQDIVNLAADFRSAIASSDPEKLRDILSPDCVIWYNQLIEPTVTLTREQAIETVIGMSQFVEHFRYTDVQVDVLADGYVQQSILRFRTRAKGVECIVPVCLIARVGSDGMISRYQEYRDSVHTAAVMDEVHAAMAKASPQA